MAGKPGSQEEVTAAEQWAAKHVRSSVSQMCKEHTRAIKSIDPADEEHY